MKQLEEAEILFAKAAEDEVVLDKLIDDHEISDAIWGFHAQQAAEKLMKAVLQKNNIRFPKTHDLNLLFQILVTHKIKVSFEEAELTELVPFAVDLRYDIQEDLIIDRQILRSTVAKVRKWANTFRNV